MFKHILIIIDGSPVFNKVARCRSVCGRSSVARSPRHGHGNCSGVTESFLSPRREALHGNVETAPHPDASSGSRPAQAALDGAQASVVDLLACAHRRRTFPLAALRVRARAPPPVRRKISKVEGQTGSASLKTSANCAIRRRMPLRPAHFVVQSNAVRLQHARRSPAVKALLARGMSPPSPAATKWILISE